MLYTRNTVNHYASMKCEKNTNKKIKGTLEDVQISEDGRGGAVLASEEVLPIQKTRSEEKDWAGPVGSEQQ